MMKGVKITSTNVLQYKTYTNVLQYKTYTNICHSAYDINISQKQEQAFHISVLKFSPHHHNPHFHCAVSTHCSKLHL